MTTITGTNQNDNIVGTNGNDVINGRNGNDVIASLAGNDIINAGNGNNTITAGDGNDTISAGNGNNTIVAGNGNDTVTAGNGTNNITVGNGTDTVTVGNGNNTITAGSGADTITTGNGNNTISSGGGSDVIHTGNGNDTVNAGAGNDQVFLTGGNDVYIYNMSENIGSHDMADGGRGTDTVRLEFTQQQFNSAAVQADLAAYQAFLTAHANPNTDSGPTFHFTAFDLSVTDFEKVNVVIVNSPVVITSGPETATASELDNTTGSAAVDTTTTVPSGTLNFTDADTGDTHTVAVTLGTTSWSAGGSAPAGTLADLTGVVTTTLHDSTGTGSGSVDWNFAIPDHDVDFLAAGETLTVNYDVAVSDASTTAHQTVSVTVTGANDAVAMTSGPQSGSVSEQAGVTGSTSLDSTTPSPTGTLAFGDVDLSDTHSVNVSVNSAVWSSGNPIPDETFNDLQAALLTTLHDSTGTGTGGIDWTFAIQDHDLDFLGAGDTLTITYDVTVSDGFTSSTQQVTVTATGAADPLTVNAATGAAFDSVGVDTGNFIGFGNAITDAGDTSPDGNSNLTVSDVNGSASNVGHLVAGAHGSLQLFSDGTYLYVADASVDPLQVGDSVTDVFNFTVTDGFGRSQPTTLTITVQGADDAPVITGASAVGTLTEDAGPTVGVNGGFETGNLTGWSSSGVSAQPLFIGGAFGTYAAGLSSGSGFLEQDVSTTAGQHYTLSFYVAGDPDANPTALSVFWDGAQILAVSNATPGFAQYTFDVVGDASDPTTQLFFDFSGSGPQFIDQVSISPTPGPATETTNGVIAFSDIETGDTHTASFTPQDSNYVGTFTLDPVSESGGSGTVNWHFSVDNADIQFLAKGQTISQVYTVSVLDDHGQLTQQDVTVAISGANDAPTAVSETVISDAGASGSIPIPAWALAFNDSDPDTIDHLAVNSVGPGTGGSATPFFGFVFFGDDVTPGGSFTYDTTDGTVVSANSATATVINNAASSTVLTGTSGDDVIIATNGTETLNGGGGNDVLIGNSGSHTMTGGTGNDAFAFLSSSDGQGNILDFNNTTEHDHIVISASGFGGGLTAGQDVSSAFESSGDDQFGFSGAVFHFDSGNQTLYFSADGTTANAIAVTTVQNGVTLNSHDLIIV